MMPNVGYGRASRAAGWRLQWALPILAATVLSLAGCNFLGGGAPAAGAFDYGGSWRGNVTDEVNGAGTMFVTLQQNAYTLAGTWHVVMGADAARQDGGNWSGQLFVGQESDLLTASLSPAVAGKCTYTLTLARSNETVSGTYVAAGAAQVCAQLVRGSVQLAKQQ